MFDTSHFYSEQKQFATGKSRNFRKGGCVAIRIEVRDWHGDHIFVAGLAEAGPNATKHSNEEIPPLENVLSAPA
jgi:hypothetical protein